MKDYVRSFGIIKSKGEIIRLEDYPNISLLQTNVMKGRARGIMQPVGFAGNEVALIQYQITLLSPDHRRKHVIERIIEDPEKAKKRVEAWSEKLDLPVVKYSPPRVARRRR